MHVTKQLRSNTIRRIYSCLTSLILCMGLLLSLLGAIGNALIQMFASSAIVLGIILQLFQILIIIQSANRDDKVGWVLHRFAYVALLVIILSFLTIIGATYLSSFFVFGTDVMIISAAGYIMQASFGICLSSVSYHFIEFDTAWLW